MRSIAEGSKLSNVGSTKILRLRRVLSVRTYLINLCKLSQDFYPKIERIHRYLTLILTAAEGYRCPSTPLVFCRAVGSAALTWLFGCWMMRIVLATKARVSVPSVERILHEFTVYCVSQIHNMCWKGLLALWSIHVLHRAVLRGVYNRIHWG